jgi:hypothetical protein
MIKNIIFILTLVVVGILTPQIIQAQKYLRAGPAGTKVYYQARQGMFPCRWRKENIDPGFLPLTKAEISRTQEAMAKALQKYPEKILKKNLRRVYALRKLFFFGLEYGGTYYKRLVFITNDGAANGYSGKYLEGTFHHEFSSVLLKRYRQHFDENAWRKVNPDEFEYGEGGVEALRIQASRLKLDSSLFSGGFLNEYSLASLEEDWNCYAEYIFLNDPVFWQAWENNEKVRKKTSLLISFYRQLHPVFTLEYFRNL